jgi:hypothetical protein
MTELTASVETVALLDEEVGDGNSAEERSSKGKEFDDQPPEAAVEKTGSPLLEAADEKTGSATIPEKVEGHEDSDVKAQEPAAEVRSDDVD